MSVSCIVTIYEVTRGGGGALILQVSITSTLPPFTLTRVQANTTSYINFMPAAGIKLLK